MRSTRRYWLVVGVGSALGVWGVITDSPSLVIGAGAVGAWLVVIQYRFLAQVADTLPSIDVKLQPERKRVTARETTQFVFSASVQEPNDLSIRITAPTPVGVEGSITPLSVNELRRVISRSEIYWPIAGEFEFEPPQVTFTDRYGLVTQTVTHGESPTVVVEPRAPRNVHVGQGGEAIVAGFGEHETDQTGSGLKPSEVRQYVPGDSVRRIDWKATARLDEPHVREFEVETDRETTLFVDHRHSMADGGDGERKLDYARQLVLAILDSAQTLRDPVGCYTIGDEGLTARFEPATTNEHRHALREHILDLSPTPTAATDGDIVPPAVARKRADKLQDGSAFAETLGPFFEDRTQYVQRVTGRPLFEAIRVSEMGQSETGWTVIVTDDEYRTELQEAVDIARRVGGHVSVFLTPTVLFQEGTLGDIDRVYDRYVEFESFRRDLAARSRVSGFEVGPEDRLDAILGTGRTRREPEQ